MEMTNREYNKLVRSMSRPTPKWKNSLWAFFVGGAICTLGQMIQNGFVALGVSEQDSGTWTTIVLVFLSALFTSLHIYDKLANYAGAGTLVPVTGFANSVVSPAMEFKAEGFITGMAAKMFQIAGPVLVFGIGSSVVYGLILCLLGAF